MFGALVDVCCVAGFLPAAEAEGAKTLLVRVVATLARRCRGGAHCDTIAHAHERRDLATTPEHVEDGVVDLPSRVLDRLRSRLGRWTQRLRHFPLLVG
jgi:hypothetical protein